MGKTVTIYFKNNKVSKVTGTRSKTKKAEGAIYGQAFVEALNRGAPTIEAQDVEAAVKKLTEPPT